MTKHSKSDAFQRLSLKEAMHLQELESNPLDADQVAMFEMFEREGWSEEKCIEYIRQRTLRRLGQQAAE